MRLLDLFCGAGGAAVGYHRAGFEVVGVDINPQPHFPFEFHQADALTYPLEGFDVIHASPPCQAFTQAARLRPTNEHPNLIPETRARLQASGSAWIIENVPGAPLIEPVQLCGTALGLGAVGFELRRHRLFESSEFLWGLPCSHRLPSLPVFGHTPNADFYKRHGRAPGADDKRTAMGIDWMNRNELSEAIPPAFTHFLGDQLADHLAGRS
jgi:DNA (cytosine-5)-methyltransferase 1